MTRPDQVGDLAVDHAPELGGQGRDGAGPVGLGPFGPGRGGPGQVRVGNPPVVPDAGPSLSRRSPLAGFDEFLVPRERAGTQPRHPGPARIEPRRLLILPDLLAGLAGMAAGGGIRPGAFLFALLLPAVCAGGRSRSRLAPSVLDDLPELAARLLVTLALVLAAGLTVAGIRGDDQEFGRRLLVSATATSTAVIALRAATYHLIRRARRAGRLRHRTLIVGADPVGRRLARSLTEHREYGLEPIGFLDLAGPAAGGYPILGRPDQLAEVVRAAGVHTVVVSFGGTAAPDLTGVIRSAQRCRCEILLVPRLSDVHPASGAVEVVRGLPLVRLRGAAQRGAAWRIKRAVDLLACALALPLISPLLLAVALAVRMETGPGVVFRQERVGLDGRRFWLFKFRSIIPISEAESATTWSVRGDARLGPVGRFLRRSCLDELPQLLNVLRGEMSLVGPRPERPHFVEAFQRRYPHYLARHRVPCGLTGLAQVNGLRGDTSIDERARLDNYYIENWSLWLDLTILLRTALCVVRSEGT